MIKNRHKEKIVFYLQEIKLAFRKWNVRKRKQPDFIIVGVQKGGTTNLFEILKQHPEIETPIKKEIHFFDINYYKGKKWYCAHFPKNEKGKNFITGEASPYYIFHPEVAKRIHADFPGVKIIALLRDPSKRAYSHYQMEFRRGDESIDDFVLAAKAEKERLNIHPETFSNPKYFSFNHQHFSYLSRGHYHEQIKKLYQYFDKKQVLIVQSEKLFTEEKQTISKIYSFLGIKNVYEETKEVINRGKYFEMDDKAKLFLSEYFSAENKKLEEYLGEEFNWNKS